MKKIALCSLWAILAFGVLGTNNVALCGDVNSACYAVKGSYYCTLPFPGLHPYCGGKQAAKWIGGIAGLGAGGVVGGATRSIFGPFGTAAGAVAGGYVGAKLGAKIGLNYSANEYIYFEDGSCLECDSHQACEDFECPNRTVVTNGGKAYMCHVEGGGDHWEEYPIPICSDSERNIDPSKKYKTYLKDNVTNNGKSVKDGVLVFSGSVCMYTEEDCDCAGCCGGEEKIEPKPSPKPVKKTCKESRKTEEGKACCDFSKKIADWDDETQKCVCADKKASFEKVNGRWQCVPKVGACDSFKGNPEAYACCTAGYLWQNGKCEGCPDGQKWYWDGTKGICIDVEVVNPTDCTPSDCEITIKQSVLCNNGHYLSSTETYGLCKEDLNARNLNCEQFKAKVNSCKDVDCIRQWLTRLDAYDELIARVCKDSGNAPVVNPNNAEIEEAKRTLTAFFADAEKNRNVWRDEEGKFNTVRLASDLTAGVVLGTVGGVVSGVVIKKKQVEKGFDALHCTVGGQTIADWGDTFNVGLRR